jgi:hypothetical protein
LGFYNDQSTGNGKLCFVEDGTVKVAKPDFSGDIETVVYGSSVHEFDGEIDAETNSTKLQPKHGAIPIRNSQKKLRIQPLRSTETFHRVIWQRYLE